MKSCAAAMAIFRPAFPPPVNDTMRTRLSCASTAERLSSATGTTLSTPAGRPASCSTSPSSRHTAGVCGDGLRIKLLPAASANASFFTERISG